MTLEKLDKVIAEAQRFLSAAVEARRRMKNVGFTRSDIFTAATRRASMDLTRALANLRKREE